MSDLLKALILVGLFVYALLLSLTFIFGVDP